METTPHRRLYLGAQEAKLVKDTAFFQGDRLYTNQFISFAVKVLKSLRVQLPSLYRLLLTPALNGSLVRV